MKKFLIGLVLGTLVALPTAGQATHVNEPTAAIVALDLAVENYATNTPADCSGVVPFDFDKARVAMYVTSASTPSEHFTAQLDVFRETTSPKEQVTWQSTGLSPRWDHQNVPPHVAKGSTFDASRLTDYVGLKEHPGRWLIVGSIEGDESGAVFADSCTFVVEGDQAHG
jgi:hypothetical protein